MVLAERFALLEQKYHASMKDSLEMPLLLVFALATDRLSLLPSGSQCENTRHAPRRRESSP